MAADDIPAVLAASSCLPEVTGGAWPIVAQDNTEALAQELDDLVFDEDKRAMAISSGLARAAQFTWEASARKTLAFFQHISTLGTTSKQV